MNTPRGECAYLISTIVCPTFQLGTLRVGRPITDPELLRKLLSHVWRNFSGHPKTTAVLRTVYPEIPDKDELHKFWTGTGVAIAARPRGGVRNASQNGDTEVTISDLEIVPFVWSTNRKPEIYLQECGKCGHTVLFREQPSRLDNYCKRCDSYDIRDIKLD
jgi:hypothetical protein